MMRSPNPEPAAFQGKTYSLQPSSEGSDRYYKAIAELADTLLQTGSDLPHLLTLIKNLGRSRRNLRKIARHDESPTDGLSMKTLEKKLEGYTLDVESHLQCLRGLDRWDRTLSTTREQYFLYMLEIELVNRLCAEQFRGSAKKFAFLPHCLRDLTADCKAAQRDVDYVCKGCTDGCNVNHASKMLRLRGVKPYIWMSADLRALFRKVKKEGNTIGVLGIACIPELVRGMRMCLKHDVPVVGVPLDANRCRRWWGKFYWNSVNLTKLESLLTCAPMCHAP